MVIGAGRGIGREIALRLARSGTPVVLGGRDRGALEAVAAEISPGPSLVGSVDLLEPASVARLAEVVADRYGTPATLVCNSGIVGPVRPLWEVPLAEWQETIDVNLTGAYVCMHAFLPGMIRQGHGSVVLVGSMTGKRPLQHRSAYAASKAGLVGLCRSAAAEAGPFGVRVNLVSPGPVTGPRLDSVLAAQAQARGITAGEVLDSWAAPLGGAVDGAQVADAVAFLAGAGAAAITGQDLNVSNGLVMY